MEFSKLQEEVLRAPDDKIVVMSCAASGKTTIMTEKTRRLLRAGVSPKDMAVITFTTMAATELRQRLGDDYKDGLFVGTIHALANYFLLSSGIDTKDLLDEENFDKLFDRVAHNPRCIKSIDYIILDEAQDTDKLQFKFLLEMINPRHFFIVGDVRQSIYRWRAARPDLLLEIMKRSDVRVFDMNENYRNGSNILMFAKGLISPTGLNDTSISRSPQKGEVIRTSYSPTQIIEILRESPDLYKDWAILTRTNKEIWDISIVLKKNGIPFETFKQGDLSKDELLEKMEKNTVKLLTVHSAKGLEWKNVIVIGMKYYDDEERSVCYVAATRAKERLIWMGYPPKSRKNRYSF